MTASLVILIWDIVMVNNWIFRLFNPVIPDVHKMLQDFQMLEDF